MRKILIIVVIILLGLLAYTSVANGIQIGDLEVYSIEKIQQKNDEINSSIDSINNLKEKTYPQKLKELDTASSNMSTARSKYLEYTSLSSDSEILEAMQGKSYKVEFLWATIGTHARNEEINLKLEIASSSIGATNVNDLKFTVNGTYINIINFIYALENDADLSFKIANFKLLPQGGNGILEGTFTVSNIKIEENITADSSFDNIDSTTSTTEQQNSVVPTTDQTTSTVQTTNQTNTTTEASSSSVVPATEGKENNNVNAQQ